MTRIKKVLLDETESRIRAAVEVFASIPDAEWEKIRHHARVLDLKRGKELISKGARVDHTYFVDSGLLRVYYLNNDREINRSFVLAGRFYTNSLAFHTGEPSGYTVQALETTRLVALSREAINLTYEGHPSWDRFGRLAATQGLILREKREERFRSLSPEQHYRWLVETGSPLVQRIPLYHLASYLGIAPETLSRIRGRVSLNVG